MSQPTNDAEAGATTHQVPDGQSEGLSTVVAEVPYTGEQGVLEEGRVHQPPDPEKVASYLSILSTIPAKDFETLHPPQLPSSVTTTQGSSEDMKPPVAPLDWDGPNDPADPRNWNFWVRVYHTMVPGIMGLMVTLGSSVYTPGIPDIEAAFGVSSTVSLLGLSLYVLGLGFGPMLAAPMSETLGRRAVYLISYPIASLFILGAGFSNNIASLVICRFLAGLFGSPSLAVGAGTNADVWPPEHRAIASSFFILAPFAGPALGPVIGGYASERYGWRWTEWPLLFATIPVMLFSFFTHETYKKIILSRRAKARGLPLPPKPPPARAAKLLLTVTLFRPIHMLYAEPIVASFSIYTAFNFAVLFGFFDAFPIVFQGVYGFSRGHAGLPWLAVLVGCILAVATIITIDRLVFFSLVQKSRLSGRGGAVAPEHRLYAAMAGSLGVPLGLFWFAWTARPDVHWMSPTAAAVPFAWGNLCIFTSCALYLIDVYGPMVGASAMAANGLLRYVFGAVFPLFTIQMYERLGIGWATSLLGFVSVAMLPIPWVLFKFGPRIRSISHYETIKI